MSPKVAEHAEALASAARELKRNFDTVTVENKNTVLKGAITALIGITYFQWMKYEGLHYNFSESWDINGTIAFLAANALALPAITLWEMATRQDKIKREALTIGLTVVETFLALECLNPGLLSSGGRVFIANACGLGILTAASSAFGFLVLRPESPCLYRS